MGDFQAASHVISLCWVPCLAIWVWVNTYRYIFSGMNIHLPAILGFTRYQGFDPSPFGLLGWVPLLHGGFGHFRYWPVRAESVRELTSVNGRRECWLCLGVSMGLPSLTNPTQRGRWMTTTSMRARRSCEVTRSRKNLGDFPMKVT